MTFALWIFLNFPAAAAQWKCETALATPNPLIATWTQAVRRLPEIRDNARRLTGDERLYFAEILAATEAAVGKHQREFEREKHWRSLDVPRHMEILKQIAEFDSRKPKFSFYKIKRAIEGRHSLREYIHCRSTVP